MSDSPPNEEEASELQEVGGDISGDPPDAEDVDVDDLEKYFMQNGFYTCSGRGNNKSDNLFHEVQGTVDRALKLVATRIAEKKAIDLENSGLRLAIRQIKEDISVEEKKRKKVEKSYMDTVTKCEKVEGENEELSLVVANLREKTNERRTQLGEELGKLREYKQALSEHIAEEKEELRTLVSEGNADKAQIRTDIKNIETDNLMANRKLEDLNKKQEYSKVMEQERVKMMRDKAKLLNNLIKNEEVGEHPGSIKKELAQIISSGRKKGSLMGTPSPVKH